MLKCVSPLQHTKVGKVSNYQLPRQRLSSLSFLLSSDFTTNTGLGTPCI